jgi:hypothetical protein
MYDLKSPYTKDTQIVYNHYEKIADGPKYYKLPADQNLTPIKVATLEFFITKTAEHNYWGRYGETGNCAHY